MKYIVREPHKSGGKYFDTATAAVDCALDWYEQTGIPCEIWVSWQPERDMEYRIRSECDTLPTRPSMALLLDGGP